MCRRNKVKWRGFINSLLISTNKLNAQISGNPLMIKPKQQHKVLKISSPALDLTDKTRNLNKLKELLFQRVVLN